MTHRMTHRKTPTRSHRILLNFKLQSHRDAGAAGMKKASAI